MESVYSVKTAIFEGPLDLLLSLIEKRKLFINDISLSLIADDYMREIEKRESFPIAETANFILVASTLVLIKSKSLIPSLNLTEEETAGIEDLELRLKIYKKFKEVSLLINEKFGKNIIFFSNGIQELNPVFSPPKKLSLSDITLSINRVMENLPKPKATPTATVRKVMSLEEMMDNLAKRVERSIKMSFRSFSEKKEKLDVIISFLAMLELVKIGVIAVKQESNFHDIEIEHNKTGVPRY